jgi:hypothetical protein
VAHLGDPIHKTLLRKNQQIKVDVKLGSPKTKEKAETTAIKVIITQYPRKCSN